LRHFVREVLITVILALIIFFVARATIQTFIVVMTSMEPSFHDGQRLVVNKATYFFGEPERGDVVVFKAPGNRQGDYIKRIIGLPDDTVEVKDRLVFVNDSPLDEPYLESPPSYTLDEKKVPENSYFVLGDNRDNSNDSHHGWFVPREDIIGKAWLSTWPPALWGTVPQYPLAEQLASATTD